MTDKALYCVSQNCPLLEELSFGNLINCDNFSNHGLFSIAERSLNLKYLFIIGSKNIDDNGVMQLVESCHGLTYITMYDCMELTDISLIAIGEHCPLLREADFINCFNISARGVYCLIRSCRGLNKLIVSSCTGISDDNIDDVKENEQVEAKNHQTEVKDQQTEAKDSQLICKFAIHSHLKDLNLRWCTNISKATVLRFTGICPDLREIDLLDCFNNSNNDDFIFRFLTTVNF